MYFHYDRGHFFLVLKLVSKQGNMPLQFVTWSYDVLMCVCVKPEPAVRPISIFLPPSPFVIIIGTIQNIRGQAEARGSGFFRP